MATAFPDVSERERVRIDHFMGLLGAGSLGRVLEIGARDGRVTQFLLPQAESLVALDLELPSLQHDAITCVAGNLVDLPFDDRSFDTVVCTEVLEHIPKPGLHDATRELARVTGGRLLVGVPYEQDIRLGAMRCAHCGAVTPPWGHVNSFSKESLLAEFPTMRVEAFAPCGTVLRTQSEVSAFLEAWLDYPNGTWEQEEPCVVCGATLKRPPMRLRRKLAARVPRVLNAISRRTTAPKPAWMHVVLRPSD